MKTPKYLDKKDSRYEQRRDKAKVVIPKIKLKQHHLTIEEIKELQILNLSAAISCQLLNADLLKIEGQPICTRELKQAVNNCQRELQKVLDGEFYKALKVNEEVIMNLSDNCEALIDRIASYSPVYRMAANQVLHKYVDVNEPIELETIELCQSH